MRLKSKPDPRVTLEQFAVRAAAGVPPEAMSEDWNETASTLKERSSGERVSRGKESGRGKGLFYESNFPTELVDQKVEESLEILRKSRYFFGFSTQLARHWRLEAALSSISCLVDQTRFEVARWRGARDCSPVRRSLTRRKSS